MIGNINLISESIDIDLNICDNIGITEGVKEIATGLIEKAKKFVKLIKEWIGTAIDKIKKAFSKEKDAALLKKDQEAAEKVKEEIKNADEDEKEKLEEKISKFNKYLAGATAKFNENFFIDEAKDTSLYYIESKERLTNSFDIYNVRMNQVKEALKDKDATKIGVNKYLGDSIGGFVSDKSQMTPLIGFKGRSDSHNLISYYCKNNILAGCCFKDDFYLSDIDSFPNEIKKIQANNSKSTDILTDLLKDLDKIADEFYKLLSEIENLHSSGEFKDLDRDILNSVVNPLIKSIGATKTDINTMISYFGKQKQLIWQIQAKYAFTFFGSTEEKPAT